MEIKLDGQWWKIDGDSMKVVALMRKEGCDFEHCDYLLTSWMLRLALAGF